MNKEREQFLEELQKSCRAEDVPSITKKNAEFLHFLVRLKKAKSVLEIGTAHGYSTIWLADAVEPFGGKVTTIDHSTPSFQEAMKNFEKLKLESLIDTRFGRAQEVLPNLNEQFDVIFIDAIKKSYAEFWQFCKPLMKSDTLVIFDDVLKFPAKTKAFHDLMDQETNYQKTIVPTDEDDGIMLVQKIS